MTNVAALSGWVLSRIAALDLARPGIAGHYLRSSSERRQVVAAYLAMQETSDAAAAEQAAFLAGADHDAILLRAFGSVPTGFRGALRRAGPQPHVQPFYPLLHRLLAAPPHADFARAIQQLAAIDLGRLNVARALSQQLCRAGIVERLMDEEQARELSALIPHMMAAGADRARLVDALAKCTGRGGMDEVLARWSLTLTFPPCPLPPTEKLRPVVDGRVLQQTALRFRNCMRIYVADLMDGLSAFAEFSHGDAGAIIHLQRTNDVWHIGEIYGPRNREVTDELRAAAEGCCREHGIEPRLPTETDRSDWRLLRRASQRRQFHHW